MTQWAHCQASIRGWLTAVQKGDDTLKEHERKEMPGDLIRPAQCICARQSLKRPAGPYRAMILRHLMSCSWTQLVGQETRSRAG